MGVFLLCVFKQFLGEGGKDRERVKGKEKREKEREGVLERPPVIEKKEEKSVLEEFQDLNFENSCHSQKIVSVPSVNFCLKEIVKRKK